ncbi:MAG TPA: FmdB family zinc ribbon protein [Terriglobia bacterium]|nr:FmdB family zinc ribbon protein [Terriglobia bacterium]
MPIYEYRCEKCGHHFEVIQKFSDEPLRTCSSCKGKLTKLISQTSFQFKGSGWYVTDYAKKSQPRSDSKTGEKGESSTEPSKETPTSTPKAEKKD